MQNLIIFFIILFALIYVGRKLINTFRPGGSSSCCCDCSGCGSSSCSSLPTDKHKEQEEHNR